MKSILKHEDVSGYAEKPTPSDLLEQMGILSAYILAPEDLLAAGGEEFKGHSAKSGYALVLRVSEKFVEEVESRGGGVVVRAQVLKSNDGQGILLIRLQAGASLAALMLSVSDPKFIRLLRACSEDGFISVLAVKDKSNTHAFGLPLSKDMADRMILDGLTGGARSNEEALVSLALNTVSVYRNELVTLIPEQAKLEDVSLSVVLPGDVEEFKAVQSILKH
jgi:hypothetical protein